MNLVGKSGIPEVVNAILSVIKLLSLGKQLIRITVVFSKIRAEALQEFNLSQNCIRQCYTIILRLGIVRITYCIEYAISLLSISVILRLTEIIAGCSIVISMRQHRFQYVLGMLGLELGLTGFLVDFRCSVLVSLHNAIKWQSLHEVVVTIKQSKVCLLFIRLLTQHLQLEVLIEQLVGSFAGHHPGECFVLCFSISKSWCQLADNRFVGISVGSD